MENIEQFMQRQAAELAKKQAELAEFAALGDVPGLEPWLIFSKLYGIRHVGFKLVNLEVFLAWAKENCRPVHAIEGNYKGFYPSIPDTKDYDGSKIVATGDCKINYSTIMQRFDCNFYKGDFRIGFEIKKHVTDLMPRPVYKNYSPRYYEPKKIESWSRPGSGIKNYLRLSVDRQSADLESLLTFEQFENYFLQD